MDFDATIRKLFALRALKPESLLRDPSVAAICPNCGVGTQLERRDRVRLWPSYDSSPSSLIIGDDSLLMHVWKCNFCNKTTTLFIRLKKEGSSTVVKDIWQTWPETPPRQLPLEAPDAVRSMYREASLAENVGALRGAAGLYRAAVEEIVREQAVANIDGLRAKGADDDLVRDLHDARVTGNWSLHRGTNFTAGEIADLAELIGQAVHELYVEPARREEMRRAREDRRKGLTSDDQIG